MEFIHTYRNFSRPINAGFTLIELVVVLGIISVITTVAITSQSSFNKTLILSNTAYDIALTLRSAQTFGIGNRLTTTGTNNAGYGIDIDKQITDRFTLFADTYPAASCTRPDCALGDKVYTSGSDQFIQTYLLGNGMKISNFCVHNGAWSCSSGGPVTYLNVVFARPNPDPSIRGSHSAGNFYQKAYIVVSSPQGTVRYICIGSSGVINVSTTVCP